MAKTLLETGMSRGDIIDHLSELKHNDIRWAEGRAPIFVFKADDDISTTAREAFNLYFTENALGAHRAFPSIQQMEKDIVAIGLSLFHAPSGGTGYFTTGGSESIICAMKAARNWSRERRGDPQFRGNFVLPDTAHPAFTKGGDMMDMEVRRVPVGPDYRADPAAIEAAIDKDTIMIVGSAPCFPYGVIDPIDELGEVAQRHDLWLHVDACVGGYLAPFVKELGRDVPTFDFQVPGVTSISADLHKFGYTPKPASTVFYRDPDKAGHQMFKYDVWANGMYATAGIAGTRPGGGVAGAWATLHALGRDGYLRVNARLMDLVDRYKQGIEAIPGLRIVGKPHLSIISLTSDEVDMLQAGERMRQFGWLPGFINRPKGMHLMLSRIHEPACDPWLKDLRTCVERQRAAASEPGAKVQVVY